MRVFYFLSVVLNAVDQRHLMMLFAGALIAFGLYQVGLFVSGIGTWFSTVLGLFSVIIGVLYLWAVRADGD